MKVSSVLTWLQPSAHLPVLMIDSEPPRTLQRLLPISATAQPLDALPSGGGSSANSSSFPRYGWHDVTGGDKCHWLLLQLFEQNQEIPLIVLHLYAAAPLPCLHRPPPPRRSPTRPSSGARRSFIAWTAEWRCVYITRDAEGFQLVTFLTGLFPQPVFSQTVHYSHRYVETSRTPQHPLQ